MGDMELAATPDYVKGADIHYVGDDQPLPEMHSLAALVHKRREPYAFEQEFRLLWQRPKNEKVVLDAPADFGRLVPVDPVKLVQAVRFHPTASPEFKARVRANLGAAGLTITARDSAFTPSK